MIFQFLVVLGGKGWKTNFFPKKENSFHLKVKEVDFPYDS